MFRGNEGYFRRLNLYEPMDILQEWELHKAEKRELNEPYQDIDLFISDLLDKGKTEKRERVDSFTFTGIHEYLETIFEIDRESEKSKKAEMNSAYSDNKSPDDWVDSYLNKKGAYYWDEPNLSDYRYGNNPKNRKYFIKDMNLEMLKRDRLMGIEHIRRENGKHTVELRYLAGSKHVIPAFTWKREEKQ